MGYKNNKRGYRMENKGKFINKMEKLNAGNKYKVGAGEDKGEQF